MFMQLTPGDIVGLAALAAPLTVKAAADVGRYFEAKKQTQIAHVFAVAGNLAGHVSDALNALPPSVVAATGASMKARLLTAAGGALTAAVGQKALSAVGISDSNAAISAVAGQLGKIANANWDVSSLAPALVAAASPELASLTTDITKMKQAAKDDAAKIVLTSVNQSVGQPGPLTSAAIAVAGGSAGLTLGGPAGSGYTGVVS